ncbi:DgyrCDS3706 [Dimorphilus gyrociliatus]|uniref:DgyrCDS3706 n=1 Tax=Dimorphilus gyrociliatus TaxID=2664684 RepID=A0A7I8VER5_9ANNE|nr:DgyrCDS3706 [Dimorphilus gyrociliatus]
MLADYWKSNPKHFCEFCNCWFAENKSSVEHHEQGKRHKENVQKRLRELGELGKQQDKDKQFMSNSLMAMEQAAMRALQKDITKNPNMAGAYGVRFKDSTCNYVPIPEMATEEPGASKRQKVEATESITIPQVQEFIPKPKAEPSALVKDLTNAALAAESLREGEWQELKSNEGYTYYWHTGTNAVQWEPPEGFIPTEELQEIPLPSGSCPIEPPMPPEQMAPPIPPVKLEKPEASDPQPDNSQFDYLAVKSEPTYSAQDIKPEPLESNIVKTEEEEEESDIPPAFLTLAPQKSNTDLPYGTWQTVRESQAAPIDLGLPEVVQKKSNQKIIKLEDSKFTIREKKANTFSKEFEEFKKRKLASKKKPNLRTSRERTD